MDLEANSAHSAPPMLDLIAASPVAHVLVSGEGQVLWCNPAAAALLGAQRIPTGARLSTSLGLPVPIDHPEPRFSPVLQRWLQISASPLDDGSTLLVFTDAQAWQHAKAGRQRAEALLDLVREVGRLGTWRRDVHSLTGEWDDGMFQIFGLSPQDGTPVFDQASSLIMPEDRAATRKLFEQSLREPGVYDQRYRVNRPDGEQRQLHALWRSLPGPDGLPEQILGVVFDDTQAWKLAHQQHEQASEMALAEQLVGLARWRHDLRTQRMHYSADVYALLGLEPRPEGLSIDEVRSRIHPDDLPAVVASAQRTLETGEPTDFEARYQGGDGRWRIISNRRALLRDDKGSPMAFIGVSMDVSGRVAADQQARDLASRLRMAARAAGIGYWSLEPGAAESHWNLQMRQLHGLERDAPVPTYAQWLERHVVAADRTRVHETFQRLRGRNGWHDSLEFRILDAKGRERILMATSQNEQTPQGTASFGIAIDVTARREADIALHRAHERAALAAEGAGIATWDVDVVHDTVIWDAQMWRLRGRPPRAAPPTLEEHLEMLHPDEREAGRLRHVQVRAGAHQGTDFRVLWPDGTVRWLATQSVPMLDAQGEVVRRIGINWDVTDARMAESERREREVAEQANLAKTEFLSRMSHELRTPLNAVLGFAQLLLVDARSTKDTLGQSRLQHVIDAGQHLLALINDVLALSGLEGGQLTVRRVHVPLSTLMKELVPLLEPLRQTFGVPAIEQGPIVGDPEADPTRLRQVMLNLLSNAIKYNRPGGLVRVETSCTDDEVAIHVIDTGVGLSKHQLTHLYEPFNRLGNEALGIEGSGIGLTITKTLVELMQGRLEVDSAPGKGSRFTVHLPLHRIHATPAPAELVARPGSSSPPLAQGRVLYIEDNAVNMMVMDEMLRQLGEVTLLRAIDGSSGLHAARTLQPDLVLLDMQLPDMTGMEVFQALKSDPRTAHLRCVAVSANAHPADRDRALAAGLCGYWTKPLSMPTLLASLQQLLGSAAPRPADPQA